MYAAIEGSINFQYIRIIKLDSVVKYYLALPRLIKLAYLSSSSYKRPSRTCIEYTVVGLDQAVSYLLGLVEINTGSGSLNETSSIVNRSKITATGTDNGMPERGSLLLLFENWRSKIGFGT
jgi:hypothetical protein